MIDDNDNESRVSSILISDADKKRIYQEILAAYGGKYRIFSVIKRELGWSFRSMDMGHHDMNGQYISNGWWVDFKDGVSKSMFLMQFEFESIKLDTRGSKRWNRRSKSPWDEV